MPWDDCRLRMHLNGYAIAHCVHPLSHPHPLACARKWRQFNKWPYFGSTNTSINRHLTPILSFCSGKFDWNETKHALVFASGFVYVSVCVEHFFENFSFLGWFSHPSVKIRKEEIRAPWVSALIPPQKWTRFFFLPCFKCVTVLCLKTVRMRDDISAASRMPCPPSQESL